MDFNKMCQWFKEVAAAIPRSMPQGSQDIVLESLPPMPQFSDQDLLLNTVHMFKDTLAWYNEAARTHRNLLEESQRTGLDALLIYFSSVLLSLALAIQTTKITVDTWFRCW
jgi:hypothetical protein